MSLPDLRDPGLEPAAVIAALDLRPHPEGGHYREIWRDPPPHLHPHPEGGHYREIWRDPPPQGGGRGAGTAIYYLLAAGEVSHWHRVDAAEAWHWYGGGPLELRLSEDGRGEERRLLGPDLGAGQQPFLLVPRRCWQAARPLGRWTLAGCTVSPGFDFAGFELAPPGWQPGG